VFFAASPQKTQTPPEWGGTPSMGVTCGCVREPGSLTLPFGVGCLRFSTKSKNANTPPEWAGTLLRACFAVRKQSPPQVIPVGVGTPLRAFPARLQAELAAG